MNPAVIRRGKKKCHCIDLQTISTFIYKPRCLRKGNSFYCSSYLLFNEQATQDNAPKVVRLCKIERFEGLSQLNKPKPIKLLTPRQRYLEYFFLMSVCKMMCRSTLGRNPNDYLTIKISLICLENICTHSSTPISDRVKSRFESFNPSPTIKIVWPTFCSFSTNSNFPSSFKSVIDLIKGANLWLIPLS